MQRLFLSLVAALLCVATVVAQNAPKIEFETLEINYGTIERGSDGVRNFTFKNIGGEPLKIESARGSCGCTVPSYPEEAILAGASDMIRVKYDTNRLGAFTKYVTLKTNDPSNAEVRLKISGTVYDLPPALPEAEPNFMTSSVK